MQLQVSLLPHIERYSKLAQNTTTIRNPAISRITCILQIFSIKCNFNKSVFARCRIAQHTDLSCQINFARLTLT